MGQFDDIEAVSFMGHASVDAADMTGSVGDGEIFDFEGLQLVDYDEVVDRNEELHLLHAEHRAAVWANSTETEDGTVAAAVEVSASPARQEDTTTIATNATSGAVDTTAGTDDSIDLIGRTLTPIGHAPFSDTSTGVGGAGTAGVDTYDSSVWPEEIGRFHPRDELFLNGMFRAWNIDDAGIWLQLNGQHVYGVIEG